MISEILVIPGSNNGIFHNHHQAIIIRLHDDFTSQTHQNEILMRNHLFLERHYIYIRLHLYEMDMERSCQDISFIVILISTRLCLHAFNYWLAA